MEKAGFFIRRDNDAPGDAACDAAAGSSKSEPLVRLATPPLLMLLHIRNGLYVDGKRLWINAD